MVGAGSRADVDSLVAAALRADAALRAVRLADSTVVARYAAEAASVVVAEDSTVAAAASTAVVVDTLAVADTAADTGKFGSGSI
jgi:hypothetical protein